MIAIRKAQAQDASGITQCVEKSYRHYIPRLGKPPGPMLDDYAEIISNHTVYVALTEQTIVGVLVIMENYTPVLLDNLAVDPAQQGTGLGKRLLFLAEELVQKNGHDTLQLYTHELMHENLSYYQKFGYQISHRVNEKGYQRIYMCKQLNGLSQNVIDFRPAVLDDAMSIAQLHALSWQNTYKGILCDSYLSSEVLPQKQETWIKRLSDATAGQKVILAENQHMLCGFACIYLNHDSKLGAFMDNLHVHPDCLQMGLGKQLMQQSIQIIIEHDPDSGLYLSVFETNQGALNFYLKQGGRIVLEQMQVGPDGAMIKALHVAWDSLSTHKFRIDRLK